jgi:hypothetical protein
MVICALLTDDPWPLLADTMNVNERHGPPSFLTSSSVYSKAVAAVLIDRR